MTRLSLSRVAPTRITPESRLEDGSRTLLRGQYRQPTLPALERLRRENDTLVARNAELEHVLDALTEDTGRLNDRQTLLRIAAELKSDGGEWHACGELIDRAIRVLDVLPERLPAFGQQISTRSAPPPAKDMSG